MHISGKPLRKVLIANRGEIAVRIIRACRELGIETVAVYSSADREALHVRMANEAHLIGPPPSAESYLVMEKLLAVAQRSGADAVHPGYGFLSERAGFARAVQEAGLTFIGPPADAIEAMGEKTRARQRMDAAGVPVVPGTLAPLKTAEEAKAWGAKVGYPVMLKAAAGGGGKGMRKVDREGDLAAAFNGAAEEALAAFGDGSVYLEKFIDTPRHIEVQLLADTQGNIVHLFERECSLQRRHQKVIEEAPSPFLTPELREQMGAAAVAAARAVGYVSAGTVEFLVDAKRNFYFMEMNTRIQVEHPVTEWITGVDLIKAQLEIARGSPLPFTQNDLKITGHALECRIYAEDPENNFLPSPGIIEGLRVPAGPGVRDDSAAYPGMEVSVFYDPMIAKLSAWGEDRPHAIARMRRALEEYQVRGLTTNIPFHLALLKDPEFCAGKLDTGFIPRFLVRHPMGETGAHEKSALAAALIDLITGEKPGASGETAPVSAWKLAARKQGLRGGGS
jgi:acetyl-CoA carboxylase biotin carboxylase subunit